MKLTKKFVDALPVYIVIPHYESDGFEIRFDPHEDSDRTATVAIVGRDDNTEEVIREHAAKCNRCHHNGRVYYKVYGETKEDGLLQTHVKWFKEEA